MMAVLMMLVSVTTLMSGCRSGENGSVYVYCYGDYFDMTLLDKFEEETGIIEEIALENLYRNPTKSYAVWDSIRYDFVHREKNITLLLNTTCLDAETEEGVFPHGRTIRIRRITGYQMTTQRYIDVSAVFFADCSGDSILAPLCGAAFRFGREAASPRGMSSMKRTHSGLSFVSSARSRHASFSSPAASETAFTLV